MPFTFNTFKAVMEISTISEEAYAFILRTVFSYVLKVHAIDIDKYVDYSAIIADGEEAELVDIPVDLQYAVFLHAKHLYEIQTRNIDVLTSSKDASGSTATYKPTKLPSGITSVYRMYSPTSPVLLT